MDVERPLRCISKSLQESVVERSSSSFQEIFQRRFVNQSFWMKRARRAVVLAPRASSKQHSAKRSNCLAKVALIAHKQC